MSLIDEVSPAEASGEVQRLYERIRAEFAGRVPPVLTVMSQNPRALGAVHDMANAISFGGSTLGRRREELLATYVSTLNACHY